MERISGSRYSQHVSRLCSTENLLRFRYEGRQFHQAVARRFEEQDYESNPFQILLMRDTLVHRHERIELALSKLYQLPILLFSPASLPNCNCVQLRGEEANQLARQVLVKQ